MKHKHDISRAAIWTLLTGSVLTLSQTIGAYEAQLTSQGSNLITSKAVPMLGLAQGPLRAAAPFQEPSIMANMELLFGMLLIVAGFALTLLLKKTERAVPVHAASNKKQTMAEESKEQSFWMRIDV